MSLHTKSLVTSNQVLTVTADDVDFQGTNLVDSRTATTTIMPTTASNLIGVGTGDLDLDFEGSDLQAVATAGGLIVGSLGASGSIRVTGITKDNSNEITGTITMVATVDDSSFSFSITPSTFNALAGRQRSKSAGACHYNHRCNVP